MRCQTTAALAYRFSMEDFLTPGIFWASDDPIVDVLKSSSLRTIPVSGKAPLSGQVGQDHEVKGNLEDWMKDPSFTGLALKLGNLVVIDVDTKKSVREWDTSKIVRSIHKTLGTDPTFTVSTGWGNGSCHIYFLKPEGSQLDRLHLREMLDTLDLPHYDILTGKQYVVTPGSVHPETKNRYKVYEWNDLQRLPDKFLTTHKAIVASEAPDIVLALPPSKFLGDTEHRHRSIMKEAMFILAKTEGQINETQLAEVLQQRTMESPSASKIMNLRSKSLRDNFFRDTARKSIEWFEPEKHTLKIDDWEGNLLHLKKQRRVSDGALALFSVLLREFRRENSSRMNRSYRQISQESCLSVGRIGEYRKELESKRMIVCRPAVWLVGTHTEWTLLAPRRKPTDRLVVNPGNVVFSPKKSGGLGYAAAWVLQAASEKEVFGLTELGDYCVEKYGMSTNVRNTITQLRKEDIIIKTSPKKWVYNRQALTEYEGSRSMRNLIASKKTFYQNEREQFEDKTEPLLSAWSIGVKLAREATVPGYPVRYRTVKIIGTKEGIPKEHWSMIRWLANNPSFKP